MNQITRKQSTLIHLLILMVACLMATATAMAQPFALSRTLDDPTPSPGDAATGRGGDRFGHAVAFDGNHILIGAPEIGSGVGQAYLFDATTGASLRTFDDPTPSMYGDAFGGALALDSGRALIGAGWHDVNPEGDAIGQAHLFDIATGNLLHTFDDPTPTHDGVGATGDKFGAAVALDGNLVLIGAFQDDTNGSQVGQAHLFDANTGNLLRTFDDPTPTAHDWFGQSVALDGNHVLVGARGDDTHGNQNVGQAHLFDATTGALLRTFDNPTRNDHDQFGFAVALQGNRALIGEPSDDASGVDVGRAHLFDLTSGDLLHTFDDPTPTMESRDPGVSSPGDFFGRSLALTDRYVVIGATGDDTNGVNVGQAHLFDAVTGSLLQTFDDPTPHAGSPGTFGGGFGRSVALNGSRVLIGAPFDNTQGFYVGQAYLFETAVPEPAFGDFNADGLFDAADIDLLVGEIVAGGNGSLYDLSNDEIVDNSDLDQWLTEAAIANGFTASYLLGDANLDGTVNAQDLNNLGQSWLTSPNAWQWGDFTADGIVDASDLNQLGQNWLASIPSAALAESVPESSGVSLVLVCAFLGTLTSFRRLL